MDNGDTYTCLCHSGYAQPNCTRIHSPCESNPCRNNGECIILDTPGQFRCLCPIGFTGNRCEKRYNQCGGTLSDTMGRLTYPLSGQYDHNSQCAWIIRTNESMVLNVTFKNFDLEDSTECRFDWLQINDGLSSADQLIGRFCGSNKPLGGNFISTTNNLYLWFRSDNSTVKMGFDLMWTSIPPYCGGIIEVDTHTTISTPGSPGKYPKNRTCQWHLKAPPHQRLKLTFFSLNIEKHDNCNYDYVKVSI